MKDDRKSELRARTEPGYEQKQLVAYLRAMSRDERGEVAGAVKAIGIVLAIVATIIVFGQVTGVFSVGDLLSMLSGTKDTKVGAMSTSPWLH